MVLAVDDAGGIGRGNGIPWSVPEDLRWFRDLTLNCTVIMGRRTWESLPIAPLPQRTNIVVTSSPISEVETAESLRSAIEKSSQNAPVYVIGGKRLYEEAFISPDVSTVYLTRVHGHYECDVQVALPHPNLWRVEEKHPLLVSSSGTSYHREILVRC